MRETKPFASLSSGLLARKGAAKPAMRPQGFNSFGSNNLEDLGWNDMGHSEPATHQAEVAPLHGHAGLSPAASRPVAEPPVVAHQRALEDRFAAEQEPIRVAEQEPIRVAEPETIRTVEPERIRTIAPETVQPAAVVALPRRRNEPAKSKAAFTLRLDTDRHLKLRLACALTRVSAQQLVTGALDEFLKTLPEVEKLAEHVPAEASAR